MSTSLPSTKWAADRGEKWKTHLSGMEAMLKPIDEPLIDALGLDAPYRIADVACGGGGTTFEVVRRAPAGSAIHGFDISPALIEVARALDTAGDVSFDCADMQSSQPPGERFDRIVSRFGVMFFADPSKAFANIQSWLAPRGRFAFAVWDSPRENHWFARTREVVSEIVVLPKAAPDEPGPFRYQDPYPFLALLRNAGFAGLDVQGWRGRVAIGGGMPAPEAARFALASFSTFGELLAEAGDEAYDAALQRLTATFAESEEDGEVRLPASVHIITGANA